MGYIDTEFKTAKITKIQISELVFKEYYNTFYRYYLIIRNCEILVNKYFMCGNVQGYKCKL
jgi:hypothetical protein